MTQLVKIKIDGKDLEVPKGMNIIEAAKQIGVTIPHYCYHPHLSIAGNCRMCQVEVKGRAKLEIGCNLGAAEGMEVSTQLTSPAVKRAQEATLEFILINHPLDCTVCDQAGHCKLQDYHFEYNAKSSRFIEEKEHKVKAEPLGPTVMLDGERCIMCTRCIRFCDEVTKTSELGMLNRGDKSVIAINKDKPLDNPLSGTVVDLCPVGALTHKDWRFNTRIWFTEQKESICHGCSTGCNVKVATRDNQVVQVKARLNDQVNKEWLCDEGRYGFDRFVPATRLINPVIEGKESNFESAFSALRNFGSAKTLVLLASNLFLEDYFAIKKFLDTECIDATVVVNYKERILTDVQKILISPDYAANFMGAIFSGLVTNDLEKNYSDAITKLKAGEFKHVLAVGNCVAHDLPQDLKAELSVAIISNSECVGRTKISLPSRSSLEKSGLMLNRNNRLQYSERLLDFPESSEPEWRIFAKWAENKGRKILATPATNKKSDRDMTLEYLAAESRLAGMSINTIKGLGISLQK